MDCSPPGSWVYGILQAIILKCAVISFSRESSRPGGQTCISCSLITLKPETEVELPGAEGKGQAEEKGRLRK